jgi:hypothetical protein
MPDQSAIVGQFVHTFDSNGKIECQGQIIELLGPDQFLCQWFSALTGEPTFADVQPLSAMTNWRFYVCEDRWRRASDADMQVRRS